MKDLVRLPAFVVCAVALAWSFATLTANGVTVIGAVAAVVAVWAVDGFTEAFWFGTGEQEAASVEDDQRREAVRRG